MPNKKPPEKRPVEICGNCLNFRLHFVQYQNKGDFLPLDFGHCVYPRVKPRLTENTCPHFTMRASESENR